jgi:hypothetical protein
VINLKKKLFILINILFILICVGIDVFLGFYFKFNHAFYYSTIFFILGIVVVGAYAVLYTVVEGMIKAGSPEKDYEALMMASKILRFASFGVLGFAGLGFLFCLLGIFISKRKGTAIAGIIIGLLSLAFMIIILFVPQVLQPLIDSVSKSFS